MTELHRLWVLADAARRQTRGAQEAGRTAGKAPSEDPRPSGGDDDGDSREDAGPDALPDVPPGTDADTGAVSAPASASDGRSAAPPEEPPPEEPPSEEPAPKDAHPAPGGRETGSGTPPASPRPPWYSRYRRPVRAGAVTAATAVVAALIAVNGVASPGGEPRTSDAPASDAASRRGAVAADGVRSDPPHPSGQASAGRPETPSVSPSPAPSPPRTGPEAPRPRKSDSLASESPTAPRSGDGVSATPLVWSARSHVWASGCDHQYLIARDRKVPPPPSEQDAEAWAGALDAVHGGRTNVLVTVQGTSSTAVVLESLKVRVVSRGNPVQRDVYRMNDGCGGALSPRFFDIDLDQDRPLAHAKPGNDTGQPIPAVEFPYRVSSTDPEVLLVTGRTVRCDCRWYLELEWSSLGRSGTVRIDDHGRPFRTSGTGGLPTYGYDTSARRWAIDE